MAKQSTTSTPGLPSAAVFSLWFGVAAVAALLLLIALWRTPYRSIAVLLAAAVVMGWVLRYYPVVRSQIAGSADYIVGVTPTGVKS